MKRFIIIVTLLCLTVSAFCRMPRKNEDEAGQNAGIQLLTARDSASYAMGVAFASDLLRNFGMYPASIDTALMVEAFRSTMKGDSLQMEAAAAGEYIQNYMMTAQKEKDKKNIAVQVAWLENNAKQPGVKQTPSGLQYKVIKEGSGEHPNPTSNVTVHYEGSLTDGTVFDSSYKRGEPATFRLNQVIKGWTEGVQLMQPGAEYMLYIPYKLAYGEQGAGGRIPPYSTLIFKIQLINVAQ